MQKEPPKISLILLILAFLGMIFAIPFQSIGVGATYVTGHIGEDTTWNIAGSPYVITNDVVIDAGSTLTLEPGVEVQFDGNFALTVNGSFYAIGNEDSPIAFTSSKLNRTPGDWNTIEFTGAADESFTMKYSVIEYAIDGLTIESAGKTIIEKSWVTDVSQRGTYVKGTSNTLISHNTIEVDGCGIYAEGERISGIIITDNYIVSDDNRGIYISGQPPDARAQIRNVTISNNTILSKMDGIRLYAHYTKETLPHARISAVTISNNTLRCSENGIYLYAKSFQDSYINRVTISSNSILLDRFGDGIHLHADGMWSRYLYDVVVSNNKVSNATNGIYIFAGEHNTVGFRYDVTIVGNRVSDSDRGIFVFGALTLAGIKSNITANSVCHNLLGISYETNAYNLAHYNHIYHNSQGMTISNGATVNATYNYWGDETGPYHAALNPTGKGNSVNGNGTDLEFIPFLSAPLSSLNESPVAVLETDHTTAAKFQFVEFNASASRDDGRVDAYFFDFGDGTNSSWIASSTIEHNYLHSGIFVASLIVRDDLGLLSENTAIKTITVLPLLLVSLTLEPATMHSGEEALVKVHVTSETIAVEGALIRITSDIGGTFTHTSSITDTNGDFVAVFTVANITVPTSIKIAVNASKDGFYDGFDFNYLTVLPPEDHASWIWISGVAMIAVIAAVLLWKKTRSR